MTDPRTVCVLGMHRSGTSLVARLLNLLGVYLGPDEHLMEATSNNPRGYWEHRQITNLDEEVLARLGGSWDEPPSISVDVFAVPELADLRREARAIVDSDFADSPLWGWKDPRTCLVLPFWQLVVPPSRYILCLRNPLDVARSLARSDGVGCGLALWLRYTKDSLDYTRGHPRLLVFYEDMFRDWRSELRRLAAFAGLTKAVDPASRRAVKEGIVDDELWHHRTALPDALDDPRLPFPVKSLYLALLLGRRLQPRGFEPLPQGAIESFAAAALDAFQAGGSAPRTETARSTEGTTGEVQALAGKLRRSLAEGRSVEHAPEVDG
jgi:hypothetical protein